VLSGAVGHIKWGHYTAAALTVYTATPSNPARTEWTVRATVVLDDAFKMAQRPLVFVAKHAKGEWRFPIRSVARDEAGALMASCGEPEAWTK
jgi:hypothetical protein